MADAPSRLERDVGDIFARWINSLEQKIDRDILRAVAREVLEAINLSEFNSARDRQLTKERIECLLNL